MTSSIMHQFHIIVKPNSKVASIQQGMDGTMLVSVKAPPLEGKANKAVIELLSKHLSIPKTNINIIKGHKAKYKTVEISGK